MPCQFGRRGIASREFVATIEHVGIGHFLVAVAHLNAGAIFLNQRPQLLEEVWAEEVGLGHRGGIDAGRLELAPRPTRRRDWAGRRPNEPKFGIAEPPSLFGVRGRSTGGEARQRVALSLEPPRLCIVSSRSTAWSGESAVGRPSDMGSATFMAASDGRGR